MDDTKLTTLLDSLKENLKGNKGEPGDRGPIPQLGVDYLREDELQNVADYIREHAQSKIKIPKLGEDYLTPDEIGMIVTDIAKQVPVPKNGRDAVVDYKRVVDDLYSRIELPKHGRDGSPDSAEKIVEKLRSIKGENGLRYEDIFGAPSFELFQGMKRGGGAAYLHELSDVDIVSPQDDQVLTYNSTAKRWQAVTPGASGGGVGDVVGPTLGATDSAIALFDTTTGKLLKNSTVIVGSTGSITTSIATGNGLVISGATTGNLVKITTTGALGTTAGASGALFVNYTGATGIAVQFYTNSDSASLVYPQFLIHSENVLYNQPLLQITHKTQAGLGNSPNIRLDGGGAGPQIEWRQTTDPNYGITGAGQFEQQVQGDIFYINGRNAANSSFENAIWFLRPSTSESMNGHMGIGANPYLIEKLTIGNTTGGAPRLAMKETTAPSATALYGKYWTDSTDHLAHFLDASGHDIITSRTPSGSDIVVDTYGGDYTTIQAALDAVPAGGATVYVRNGTWTITTPLLIKTSATTLVLSAGTTIQANMSLAAFTSSAMIKVNSSSIVRCRVIGGKLLNSNATAQGIAIDASDTTTCYFRDMRIEEFGTAIKMYDTANITFYNSFENIQIFNCNNGVDVGGTLANYNYFKDIRCKLKNGSGGTGLNVVNCRGLTFEHCDWEPSSATGLTGIHIDGTSRGITFINNWIENNAFGVVIDSGARETTFIRSTIHNETGTGTPLTDNGTNSIFLNTDISDASGAEIGTIRIPKFTDLLGNSILALSETASAVNYLTIANAATGGAVTLTASGTDTDRSILIQPAGAGVLRLGKTVVPDASDGAALGTTALMFSDLFLASGAVINFNNGDVTITHSTDLIAIAGGSLRANDVQLTTGSGLRTGTTAGNTLLFQARDVDGAAYTTFATLTANNTPTFDIAPTSITMTNITSGGVIAGTYTPTRSAEANMDANVTMTEAQYMRVGNTVTVSGRFTADPTLTATSTSFEITLPIASNIGAAEDVAGTAFCGTIAGMGAMVIGVAANDTAKIQWLSSDVTSQTWSYTFTYQVI